MIVEYDLTADILAIARSIGGRGRLMCRYASPAWTADLTTGDGSTVSGRGPTASQAIAALGAKLRRKEPDDG